MLACSFDEVERRINWRGKHEATFSTETSASEIANAFRDAVYGSDQSGKLFFGISQSAFSELVYSNQLVWAPDGDEAFDDGSYVLHFDVGNRVRLIGFKCVDGHLPDKKTLGDLWLDAEEFYGILEKWRNAFQAEWEIASKISILDDGAANI